MILSPNDFIILTAIMVAGTIVQASAGMGMAIVAAPLLLLFSPHHVPGPLIAAGMWLTLLMAYRDRHAIRGDQVGWAMAGRFCGTPPAALAIGLLPVAAFDFLFGFLVLTAVVISCSGWHVQATRRNVMIASFVSAITGTISAIGGPPLAIAFQNAKSDEMRGTMAIIFFWGGVLSLFGLWAVGNFGWPEIVLSFALVPGILLGFVISRITVRLLDGPYTRPAVLTISVASAVMVLCRAVF